jgi:Tol biopolymer transport system component
MIGTTLAHYEITARLGSGGMGDVYQATDSKLGRAVAIKILPEEFAREPDRVARFRREARVLASLNHPSIAAIYGIEESDGRAFIVMELVPGETLAERIRRRALSVPEALEIARQIAGALEAAHEGGIVHRDLKPANIKVTSTGTVKLLDFGIAKAASIALGGAADATTIDGATVGAVLGTPSYMSPEQARGQAVDRRTDIFAFGCVLYEMLSGDRAFGGETVTDTIANVMAAAPDWSRLPRELGPRMRELLRRCLEKEPHKRRRDCGDIRLELEQAIAEGDLTAVDASGFAQLRRRSRQRGLVAAGALAMLLLTAVAAIALWPAREDLQPVRFTFAAPLLPVSPAAVAVSPDGRYVAYVLRPTPPSPPTPLYVRAIDSLEAVPLPGTEGASVPFWSPDSRYIGFNVFGQPPMLKRIAVAGGPPQDVAPIAGAAAAAWSADDVIVFSAGNAIWRVPATGGEPTQVVNLEAVAGEKFLLLHALLPGGRFLYSGAGGESAVYAQALDSTERTRVLPFDARTQYVDGFLLFNRDSALFAQRFDADRLALSGEPIPLADNVWFIGGNGQAKFSASSGTLAYEIEPDARRELSRLALYDRTGNLLGTVGEPGDYEGVDLSPNDRHIAVHRHEGSDRSNRGDIWVASTERNTLTILPTGLRHADEATWSPDGESIVFNAGDSDLYRQDATGARMPELLLRSGAFGAHPADWHGDDVLFAPTQGGLSTIPSAGGSPAVVPFPAGLAKVSPDGRWIAYQFTEPGRQVEIYVRTYPEGQDRQQLSTAGGRFPRWTRDGKELLYLALDNKLTSVAIEAVGDNLVAGAPRALFEIAIGSDPDGPYEQPYDVSANGELFVVNEPATPASRPLLSQLAVSVNWAAELE